MKAASAKQKRKGERIASVVDDLCAEHLKEIAKGLGKKGKVSELSPNAWSGRLMRLVEDFDGVPALVAFEEKNKKALGSLREIASSALKDYWSNESKNPKKAFAAGLKLLEGGYLNYQCVAVRKRMEEWVQDAKVHGLSKSSLKRWSELSAAYTSSRAEGFKEFEKTNKRAKL